ncbi:MAG: serine/threonine protein kinase [Scytonematopsis contorta HA4267-MV1]|jgi:serine/threonine protein kinase|nr:serine/threonine protein kinase [Scytonematopsis contorta HA4267-MV1]
MLQIEQILQNRYQLQCQLGNNRVRQTWLATDLEASDPKKSLVVVKLLAFGGNVQWDDLKLFEREAQVLKQLNHRRIPKCIDYFCIDDQDLWFGLVQEYIPGESLKELINSGKKFSEKQVKRIAIEILEILKDLHGLNPPVLHRDIKPSNLILGKNNCIYLVDFGAVQDKAAKEGATFTVVGTYGYTPMEQFGGKAVPSSDLYALGATLIHLLTGIFPGDLPQRNLQIQFSDRVNLSPNFLNWLEHLTEPAQENRFASAKEALDAVGSKALVSEALEHLGWLKRAVKNNSGCGINNTREQVPDEIVGWNWGAFLVPWFWLWTNEVWVGFLCIVPPMGWIMTIALGAKGNEWAWKSRRWRSVAHFKAHQRVWTITGIILWGSAITLLAAVAG